VEGSDTDFEEEEVESTPKKRKTTPKKITPKTMSNKKRVSIMKPSAEHSMSMKELNESAAKMGLIDHQVSVGQISIPILRGGWKQKNRKADDEGGFVTIKKEFNLMRMLPHSGIALKQCELIWLDPYHLKVTIIWPKWFRSAQKQVAFQNKGSTHQFDADHDVIDSLQADINGKLEKKKDKKKQRIVDYGVFEFDLPQDISKAATEITILSVELVKDDLDADEELPPGGKVKVLQIITQQKMDDEEDNLLDVTERDVKLGNY
jgi:hypothetical protein